MIPYRVPGTVSMLAQVFFWGIALLSTAGTAQTADAPAGYFGVRVVDQVDRTRCAAGRIADGQPSELGDRQRRMGGDLRARPDGTTGILFRQQPRLRIPKDGFGYAGVRLQRGSRPRATVKIKRQNIAERLYRVTGEGIYRDSVLLGEPVPLAQPLGAGKVAGQDSAFAEMYRENLLVLGRHRPG
jgi:hypothetical protein